MRGHGGLGWETHEGANESLFVPLAPSKKRGSEPCNKSSSQMTAEQAEKPQQIHAKYCQVLKMQCKHLKRTRHLVVAAWHN